MKIKDAIAFIKGHFFRINDASRNDLKSLSFRSLFDKSLDIYLTRRIFPVSTDVLDVDSRIRTTRF